MDSGTVWYARQDHTYVLKFIGDIRYTLGYSLDTFLNQLFEKQDFENILIDLTETQSIDSTSLGLLAKIANFMRKRFGKKTTIMSTNEDVNQVLDSVGFYEVFNIHDDREAPLKEARRLPLEEPSQTELAETLLEAHSILSELNKDNRNKFKNVVEALKGEIDRKQG